MKQALAGRSVGGGDASLVETTTGRGPNHPTNSSLSGAQKWQSLWLFGSISQTFCHELHCTTINIYRGSQKIYIHKLYYNTFKAHVNTSVFTKIIIVIMSVNDIETVNKTFNINVFLGAGGRGRLKFFHCGSGLLAVR